MVIFFQGCSYLRPSYVEVPGFEDANFDLANDKFVILMSEGAYLFKNMMKHRNKDKSSEPLALKEIHVLQAWHLNR